MNTPLYFMTSSAETKAHTHHLHAPRPKSGCHVQAVRECPLLHGYTFDVREERLCLWSQPYACLKGVHAKLFESLNIVSQLN